MIEAASESKDERPQERGLPLALFTLLRPKQWTKNLIVFAPLLFSMQLHQGEMLMAASLCFVAFCLVSSAMYILNDLKDMESDRLHPTKQRRPIAAGQVGIAAALSLSLVALSSGLALGYWIRPTLCLVLVLYVLIAIAYTAALKHMVLLDVFVIAALFVLRGLAGAMAIKVPASAWFLLLTSLGALFLALEKRRFELKLLNEHSASHRKALKGYSIHLLDRLEGIVVPSLVTTYTLYSFLSFHGQWMMLSVPFVIYGIMRYQMLSVKGMMTGSPEEVLLKDTQIQITIFLWVITCALVIYGAPFVLPPLFQWVDTWSWHTGSSL